MYELGQFLKLSYHHFLIDKMGAFTAYDYCEENQVNSSQHLIGIMTNSTCLRVVSYYYSFSCEGVTPTLGRKPLIKTLVLNKSMKAIETRIRKKGQEIHGFSKVHTCTIDGECLTSSCKLSNCCWMQGRQGWNQCKPWCSQDIQTEDFVVAREDGI